MIIIMASSGGSLSVFEKLNGSDNYNNWKFLMELCLVHEDLWECVERATTARSGQAAVVDVKKDQEARAKICLLLEPQCIPHVRQPKQPRRSGTILKRPMRTKGGAGI
jgi:hypothetical protein